MAKDLIIGVDASTTACKAIVWDKLGNQISSGRSEIPMLRPQTDWHEQQAEDWWSSLVESLCIATKALNPKRLAGLCICPQRETFVPVDEAGLPLRNAILWMDNRARDFLVDLENTLGAEHFHALTGKPPSGNLTLLKIRWLLENEPKIFEQTSKFLDVAAFLNHKLTGEYATGWGIGAPAGMFNMKQNNWSSEVLSYLNITINQMPAVYPSGAILGYTTPSASRACGLPKGLPIIVGLGDGQAGGLGLNITNPGDAYLSLGTSVVSGTFTRCFTTDLAFRTMYAGIPEAYSLETVILGGTYTIDWLLEKFARGSQIDQLESHALQIPPGAEGLMLVPYWNSALTPYWDPSARGIVIGWTGNHGPAHLYRAILEGIAFELRLHFEHIENALGSKIRRLVITGGGSQSDLWCQVIADVIGKMVHRASIAEATALGAGILAAFGSGLFPEVLNAAEAMCAVERDVFTPQSKLHQYYTQLYKGVYRDIFPSVQPLVERLSELSSRS